MIFFWNFNVYSTLRANTLLYFFEELVTCLWKCPISKFIRNTSNIAIK